MKPINLSICISHSSLLKSILCFFFFLLLICSVPLVNGNPNSRRLQSSDYSSAVAQEWPTRYGRALMQATSSAPVSTDVFILAKDRTARRDPLDNFDIYRNGWDVKSGHYWASVGYTAEPGIILAALWLLLGLSSVVVLCCCCCCCCCSKNLKGSHNGGVLLPIVFLLLFTIATMVGSVLVYIYQAKTHKELDATIDYVVDKSNIVVVNLRNTSSYLNQSQTLVVITYIVSTSNQQKLGKLSYDLNDASDTLEQQTKDNAKRIRDVLDLVRLIMMVVAGVMLFSILLGFVLSTFGLTFFMYTLIVIVWFLIAATWILCGIYIMLNNVVGDTCVAMEEWVANPSANTNLKEILPCVDISTTDRALNETRLFVNDTITGVNNNIQKLLNNGSTSQGLPMLCNPLEPSFSIPNCVNVSDASKAWLPYVCPSNATSPSTTCMLGGKLNTLIYNELNLSLNVLNGVIENIPFLLDLANCNFVRDAFTVIREQHCDDLREYLKWQYIGLALISGGFMLSILLWIIVNRKRKHIFFHHSSKL